VIKTGFLRGYLGFFAMLKMSCKKHGLVPSSPREATEALRHRNEGKLKIKRH